MKPSTWYQVSAIILLFTAVAVAEDTTATNSTLSPTNTAQTTTHSITAPSNVLAGLSQDDVFNEVVSPLLTTILGKDKTKGLVEFINDWHLRPVVFHVQNGVSQDEVLGIEYNYQKSVANRVVLANSSNPMGVSFTIDAKGDVATEASKNPNNFLESGVSLHLFQGIGGIDPNYNPTKEAQLALQKVILTATTDKTAYAEAVKEFSAHMTPQFFWDLQGHVTLEADQQFINKQWAYGGKLALVYRDWKVRSDVGWFNLLDYPFAAVRWLVNHEDFQPSGRTFPSALIGLDLVDPASDGTRLAIDPETKAYPRTRVELAFKTSVLKWQDQQLYFSAAYRYFQELGASASIKAANLDYSHYFVAKLDLPYKFNISYSAGKLPMDQKNDQVYALGWALNF